MLPRISYVLADVAKEADSAHAQHGPNSMYYANPDRAMTILTEEIGEVATEINDSAIAGTDYRTVEIYDELVQAAAMAVTMAAKVHAYLTTDDCLAG